MILLTVGHLGAFPFPFPLPFPFPFPLPFPLPLPFLALSSAVAEHVAIAALAFSPRVDPAWQIFIMSSSVRHRPSGSFFAPFPPFPPFLAWAQEMARDRTRIRTRPLMLLCWLGSL